MRRLFINTLIIFLSIGFVRAEEIDRNMNDHQKRVVQRIYDSAYNELELMLQDSIIPSFKRAVFITENALLENTLNYNALWEEIQILRFLAEAFNNSNDLTYSMEDKKDIEKLGAIYFLMTDTINIIVNDQLFYHSSFKYNFNDIWGEDDWTNMFVTTLLSTHQGNCHSLPFLYKILAEEMDVPAYLSLAPNHFYIKSKCEKGGWYNTELTSATFPIDAWIMASGYISVQAVQNRLYMDTISQKQSIAICLTDLAQGYKNRFGTDANLEFILKCTDLALGYYPNYINARLLSAEILKSKFENYAKVHELELDNENIQDGVKEVYEEMEATYVNIHQLGYRAMPKEMYVQWLLELKQEKDKYLDKKIITNFKTK